MSLPSGFDRGVDVVRVAARRVPGVREGRLVVTGRARRSGQRRAPVVGLPCGSVALLHTRASSTLLPHVVLAVPVKPADGGLHVPRLLRRDAARIRVGRRVVAHDDGASRGRGPAVDFAVVRGRVVPREGVEVVVRHRVPWCQPGRVVGDVVDLALAVEEVAGLCIDDDLVALQVAVGVRRYVRHVRGPGTVVRSREDGLLDLLRLRDPLHGERRRARLRALRRDVEDRGVHTRVVRGLRPRFGGCKLDVARGVSASSGQAGRGVGDVPAVGLRADERNGRDAVGRRNAVRHLLEHDRVVVGGASERLRRGDREAVGRIESEQRLVRGQPLACGRDGVGRLKTLGHVVPGVADGRRNTEPVPAHVRAEGARGRELIRGRRDRGARVVVR